MQPVFHTVANKILAIQKSRPLIIAVDGVDGAGKTFFAQNLKPILEEGGKEVIIIAMDNFHHPKSIRYKQGNDSPSGFYYDSYDYDSFITNVILPFQQQGQYVTKVFDLDQDKPLMQKTRHVPPNAVLIVEGIFLNRPQLAAFWHYSIYLHVSVETSLARNLERSNAANDLEKMKEIETKFFSRYRPGQELYILEANPAHKASMVIDNNDYLSPAIIDKKNLFPH